MSYNIDGTNLGLFWCNPSYATHVSPTTTYASPNTTYTVMCFEEPPLTLADGTRVERSLYSEQQSASAARSDLIGRQSLASVQLNKEAPTPPQILSKQVTQAQRSTSTAGSLASQQLAWPLTQQPSPPLEQPLTPPAVSAKQTRKPTKPRKPREPRAKKRTNAQEKMTQPDSTIQQQSSSSTIKMPSYREPSIQSLVLSQLMSSPAKLSSTPSEQTVTRPAASSNQITEPRRALEATIGKRMRGEEKTEQAYDSNNPQQSSSSTTTTSSYRGPSAANEVSSSTTPNSEQRRIQFRDFFSYPISVYFNENDLKRKTEEEIYAFFIEKSFEDIKSRENNETDYIEASYFRHDCDKYSLDQEKIRETEKDPISKYDLVISIKGELEEVKKTLKEIVGDREKKQDSFVALILLPPKNFKPTGKR